MNEQEESDRERRIRQKAYQLWEEEGRPEGREEAHWDLATELIAIEENHDLAIIPVPSADALGPTGEPIEPIEAVENAGEFPTMTDQGGQSVPARKNANADKRPLKVVKSSKR